MTLANTTAVICRPTSKEREGQKALRGRDTALMSKAYTAECQLTTQYTVTMVCMYISRRYITYVTL